MIKAQTNQIMNDTLITTEVLQHLSDIWCITSPLPSQVLDADGYITSVNNEWCSLLGYERSYVLQTPMSDYLMPGSRAIDREILSPSKGSKVLRNIPIRFISRNGDIKEVLLFSKSIIMGDFVANQEILIDASTEADAIRKSLEARNSLRQLEEDFSGFLKVAAHDLRKPIRTITAFTGMLRDHLKVTPTKDDQEVEEYLQTIINAGIKLHSMVDALFEYNDNTNIDDTMSPTNLHGVIEDALSLINFSGEIEVEDDLPEVNARSSQLTRVFLNILDNSQKYKHMGRPLIVKVGSYQTDEGWVVFVQDNGMGIEEDDTNRIFRVFQRSLDHVSGSGIGLATCKKIMKAHGGDIWAESDGPDQGSTFFLYFPKKSSL